MGASIGILAGGTGGHVFPALAVAHRLRQSGQEVFWMGTPQGLEARLVPQHGFSMEWIQVSGLRGKGWKRRLSAPWQLGLALRQARAILKRRRPGLVLGMGGFASGPGGLMARWLGIPLIIQEQNRIPGLTNRWLAPFAQQVFEAFPQSFPPKVGAIPCGNPVRPEIQALPPPEARHLAAADRRRRLLVLGGSLGAQVLNETLPPALARLPEAQRPQIYHQAGERTLDLARAAYDRAGVAARIVPFIEDMAEAYGWADLVVCRSGALTVSELAAAGLGALLIPYPHAVDDHQTANARYLSDAGAAVLLPQSELNPETLGAMLSRLLQDPARLRTLAKLARSLALPEADARIAAACLEYLRP